MAKITKQAQEIMCQMVDEKAAAMHESLADEFTAAVKRRDELYGEAINKEFRDELVAAREQFRVKVEALIRKHHLAYIAHYDFKSLFDYGYELRDSYTSRLKLDKPTKLDEDIERIEAKRNEFNRKVSEAKREIVLRATLSGDYDEVMAIVNGIQF